MMMIIVATLTKIIVTIIRVDIIIITMILITSSNTKVLSERKYLFLAKNISVLKYISLSHT